MQSIVGVGDVHGEFGKLNTFINDKKPDILISVGDFGFWAPYDYDLYKRYIMLNGDGDKKAVREYARTENWVNKIKPQNTKVYFTPGNHEDWDLLDALEAIYGKVPIEVAPNIFYCPRGTFLTLEDERTVLFMGGADSIDKQWRTIGIDWFPQELIKERDVYDLPDRKVDILISHTCPESIVKHMFKLGDYIAPDCSRLALEYVFDKYRPRLVYFGHFHVYRKGALSICSHWTCLNQIGQTGWWENLDK